MFQSQPAMNAAYWKTEGNRYFMEEKFYDSIRCYSTGLILEPQNIDLLANRALNYINIGCFHRALEDAETVVKIDSNHFKGIYTRAKALQGLYRYDEAIELLNCDYVIEKLKLLERQSLTGEYDFKKLFERGKLFRDNFADFIGHVNIMAGKRRGLVATKDIPPGQLLIASKAFAITEIDDIWAVDYSKLVEIVTEKLKIEPELQADFYQLSGNETIESICILNSFTFSSFRRDDEKFAGLWIPSSYINHSCSDCNSHWVVFGDVMLIRSFRPIPEGDEILIPNVSIATEYEKREQFFKKRGISCNCRLCKLDRADSPEIQESRKEIFKKLRMCRDNDQLEELVAKLESLRKSYPKLNPFFIEALGIIGHRLLHRETEKTIDFITKAYRLMDNCIPTMKILCLFDITYCFMLTKNFKQFKRWCKILKRDAMVAFGSLEILKIIGKDNMIQMEQFGFSL